ncbi:proline-rich protein HaeIII subfamily 1-like [Macrobrachium nipponense]|uniref:proline-rich protein HaeIII subfamily 1-like n=1 Tax=Macrobrachium nipponense TaxID=159736 RepID=UPI0030C857D9
MAGFCQRLGKPGLRYGPPPQRLKEGQRNPDLIPAPMEGINPSSRGCFHPPEEGSGLPCQDGEAGAMRMGTHPQKAEGQRESRSINQPMEGTILRSEAASPGGRQVYLPGWGKQGPPPPEGLDPTTERGGPPFEGPKGSPIHIQPMEGRTEEVWALRIGPTTEG